MTLHVRVQHALVDACITAGWTFEGFGSKMVTKMVFQMMFVFGDKRTFGAVEHLLRFDVHFGMPPKIFLGHGHKLEKNKYII